MCENLSLKPWTLAHNYQKLAQGDHACMRHADCLEPIINELLDEKKGEA